MLFRRIWNLPEPYCPTASNCSRAHNLSHNHPLREEKNGEIFHLPERTGAEAQVQLVIARAFSRLDLRIVIGY